VIQDAQADTDEGSLARQVRSAAGGVTGYAPTLKIKKGSW
jgi:hypothetical protein